MRLSNRRVLEDCCHQSISAMLFTFPRRACSAMRMFSLSHPPPPLLPSFSQVDRGHTQDVNQSILSPPPFAVECMVQAMRECVGVCVSRADGENDEACAQLANQKGGYVLANDSD